MSETTPLAIATPLFAEFTTMVQVTAPETLTEGYKFHAEHNGTPFVVNVVSLDKSYFLNQLLSAR